METNDIKMCFKKQKASFFPNQQKAAKESFSS